MRYMLDTNNFIDLILGQPPKLLQQLEAWREGEACLSVVTRGELCAGIEMQAPMSRTLGRYWRT